MRDIEELLKQIIEKVEDTEAIYMTGYEVFNDSPPNYKAMVKFSREGVEPFLAGATSKSKLKKQIEDYLNGEDIKKIAIRYCEAQIKIANETILFHQGLIRDYENTSS